MLLGILRAPPPEPDDFLGLAQLVSAAKNAANVIEKLVAGLENISDDNNKTCPACHENEVLANGLLRERN